LPITVRNPTNVDASTATHGAPLPATLRTTCGASRRSASENSIRDAVYSAEFRHDATAVRITRSMISFDPGMPMASRVDWYEPSSSWS
jgi:hypothetical protein